MTLPGYEVVVEKRPSIFIPPICAGCSETASIPTMLGVRRGLSLTVGLCGRCSIAHRRFQNRWQQVLAGAALVTATAAIVLFVSPPIGVVPTWVLPAIVSVVAVALGAHLRRPPLADVAARPGTPFRTAAAEAAPTEARGLPVQLTGVRANQAILYCASPHFAAEVAHHNGFVFRPATTRPPMAHAVPLYAVFAIAGVVFGGAIWSHQYPTIAIDNGTPEAISVYLDGERLWEVEPIPYDKAPLIVRAPRGTHVIGYAVGSEAPTKTNVEITGWSGEKVLYNPGRRACFRRYAVVYSSSSSQSAELPQFNLFTGELDYAPTVDHFFTEPPKTVQSKGSSELRTVIEKDEGCSALLQAGCSIDPLLDCVRGRTAFSDLERCFEASFKRCMPSEDAP